MSAAFDEVAASYDRQVQDSIAFSGLTHDFFLSAKADQLGALFRQHFESKGRFTDYLKLMPTHVITAAAPALIGASSALDLMPA